MGTNNKQMLFTRSTKMADVLIGNYKLLTLLPRLGIQLGFGEKSIEQVCRLYNIDFHFFILVCNVYSFEEYIPDANDLNLLQLDELIGYLKSSHIYYANDRIASIETKLQQIEGVHSQIIRRFFSEYKQEVINHFCYEEEIVFPYIQSLNKGKALCCFNIAQYEENHTNIDDKLSDLKSILIKYLPQSCATEIRNSVLFDIFLFEEDLTHHIRIEEKILIPFVEKIEQKYEK